MKKFPGKTFGLNLKGILFQSESWLYADADAPGCLLIPLFIGLFLPRLFLSYLSVDDDHLVLRYWPNYELRVKWNDIDHLGESKFLGIFRIDTLFLKKKVAKDPKARIRGWGISKRCLVPIGEFRGWPNGKLAQIIKHKRPDLISD